MTLTGFFTLLHDYQTLIREIATPKLPAFATACLQLIKPSAPGKPLKIPLSLVETVVNALAAIVPLYPTTLRPFNGQIRSAVRPYLAPTASDASPVPYSLRESSRRLFVLLPFTAPKNGSAEEWAKAMDVFIRDTHITADQTFRAVQESWESTSGYVPGNVSYDGEPHGGSDSPDDLPLWTGLQSGADRLTGLLGILAALFRCPTKSPVTVPLGPLLDLVARMTSILPPPPGTDEREYRRYINANVGREERDELWSCLPDVHVATLQLCLCMIERLQSNATPLAAGMLDQVVRAFVPTNSMIPRLREVSFQAIKELLVLTGPSLARVTVDSLAPVVHACCKDLLGEAGYEDDEKKPETLTQNGSKAKPTSSNADLFLPSQGKSAGSRTSRLSPEHARAAEDLLEAFFTYLPQQHVRKAERALMDRTAIFISSRKGMMASVLHPYIDKSGRHFANTLPFLAQAFPHDQGVEILRSNLRTKPCHFGDVLGLAAAKEDEMSGSEEEAAASHVQPLGGWTTAAANGNNPSLSRFGHVDEEVSKDRNPFGASFGAHAELAAAAKPDDALPMSLKRKNEEVITSSPKRVDKGKAPEVIPLKETPAVQEEQGAESDSDESVQLQMVFDDEEDDGDDGDDVQ